MSRRSAVAQSSRARLLLEIGTEELPPAAVRPALEQLQRDATAALADARLDAERVATTGTLRRLVLTADGLGSWQRDLVAQVRGPAARIAYDAAGQPTQAAQGFARSQGVPVESLRVREIEGGRYVVAEVREAGRPAPDVLGELLPRLVAGLSFPKTMRWAAHGFGFGRPIRWVVALLDGRVIPLEIAGIRAGRRTAGHRFLTPGLITIREAAAYEDAVRQAHVVLSEEERRARIAGGAAALADAIGGRPVLDPALLDELVWSTEHPTPVLGTLEPALVAALPPVVVLVTLQHHQKCFGIVDGSGALMPAFVTVRDGGSSHLDTVRTGHEWVVRARLQDARFFLEEDRRGGFEQWNEALARIAHIAGLGTVADHVARVRRLAGWMAGAAGISEPDRRTLDRAAELCKADLTTSLVREFPELQGTIGGIYAKERGETAGVAAAVEEHYGPRAAGADLPRSLPGALLSVADRAVLLVGAVLAGLEPSGSQDPHGLRRAAAGVTAVLREAGLTISLRRLFDQAALTFDAPDEARAQAVETCLRIVRARLQGMLADDGIAYDTINAVAAVGADDVPDLVARARSLHEFRAQPAMSLLATGYLRVHRILVQAGTRVPREFREELLAEPAEIELHRAWCRAHPRLTEAAESRHYSLALAEIAALADPIDAFFDKVLVNAPDPVLRENRLALLERVSGSFKRIADFSVLVI